MKSFRSNLAAVVFLGMLTACAPRVPGDFRVLTEDEVPKDRAAVYLFRPPSLIDESAVCNMMIGETVIGGLMPGDYTVVIAEPGKTRFETVATTPAFVTIRLAPGAEVFVRQDWHLRGGGAQPALDHLPAAAALSEIRWCSFIESPPLVPDSDEEPDEVD
jgi:hypothetical protein